MHKTLQRQLKKTGVTIDEKFLALVDQAYKDADEDRELNEHALDLSSMEMQELYNRLKESADEKIRRSQERYDKLISALSNYYFFYAHDLEGKFIYVSDSVANILGYEKEEVFKHFSTFLTDNRMNSVADETFKKAINGQNTKPITLEVKDKSNNIKYLEVTAFPSFDKEGSVIEVQGIVRDITQSYQDHQKLNFLSKHDSLTTLSNRYSFGNKLEHILQDSQRNKKKFALLYIDIDNFKNVNDTLGHDTGDDLLIYIANSLKKSVRKNDVVARMGGDEFTLILTDTKSELIKETSEKISHAIMSNLARKYKELGVSISIGIAIYPDDSTDTETLIKYADSDMYAKKRQKRT